MTDKTHNYFFAFGDDYGKEYERIFNKMDNLTEYSILLAEALQMEGGEMHNLIVDNSMLSEDVPPLEDGFRIEVTVKKVRLIEADHQFISYAGAFV